MNRQLSKLSNITNIFKSSHNIFNLPDNIPIKTQYLSNIDNKTRNKIKYFKENIQNIPIVIGGKEYKGIQKYQKCPYDHSLNVCNYYHAENEHIKMAIDNTENGKNALKKMSSEEKITIFNKLADLFSNGENKHDILASTIFGQAKTIHQAEIDAVCELGDFLNFNSYFYNEILNEQPYSINAKDAENISTWNPLNGFIASITPFNFTAIGANLATTPLFMNNYVIWKPSDNSILSNYIFFKKLLETGIPPESISFLPAEPNNFLESISSVRNMAGIAFTGSSNVFENIYRTVGCNISNYNNFPRIIGETGGMNFHFIFNDITDIDDVVLKTIRGAFEYSGQKCSATSRVYLPHSISKEFIDKLTHSLQKITVDSPEEKDIFTSSVINENAYNKIKKHIDSTKINPDCELIFGGNYSNDVGYYIYPTVFLCNNHGNHIMHEEIFGPVLSIYIYNDNQLEETLSLCSRNKYGLTGSIFTNSLKNIQLSEKYLNESCGNYYINDKCTGSIVFQQPFGGSKKSGTNDKAGSKLFLTRFANNRIVKNTF